MLGYGDDNSLEKWRRKLRNQFEVTHKKGDHRGVWFHAPSWLKAWGILQRGEVASASGEPETDHATRLKRAQADKAELELAERRGELVHVDDLIADNTAYADRIRHGIELIGKIDPECQKIMVEKLDEAEAEFFKRHGGRNNKAGTTNDGA